jgi:hypothetical protein
VSHFWLTYRNLAGRLTGVVIVDSPSHLLAGLQVMSEGLDQSEFNFCKITWQPIGNGFKCD